MIERSLIRLKNRVEYKKNVTNKVQGYISHWVLCHICLLEKITQECIHECISRLPGGHARSRLLIVAERLGRSSRSEKTTLRNQCSRTTSRPSVPLTKCLFSITRIFGFHYFLLLKLKIRCILMCVDKNLRHSSFVICAYTGALLCTYIFFYHIGKPKDIMESL